MHLYSRTEQTNRRKKRHQTEGERERVCEREKVLERRGKGGIKEIAGE